MTDTTTTAQDARALLTEAKEALERARYDSLNMSLRDRELNLGVYSRIVAALAQPATPPATPEPVAWGAFLFGGKRDGKLYSWCDTKAEAEAYVQQVHQSSDSVTLRVGPLYDAPVASPATPAGEPDDRDNFERYAQQMGLRDFERNEFGDYSNPGMQGPWNFWRASRAAIKQARTA